MRLADRASLAVTGEVTVHPRRVCAGITAKKYFIRAD